MTYAIGIDVKLNEVSSMLIDAQGRIAASASVSYENSTPPESGWSEQDPEDWWAAAVETLRAVAAGVDPADIAGIGLSGEMHGLVALDAENRVIRNAILMNDERSATEYNSLVQQEGVDVVTDAPHSGFYPQFVESKLLWLRENEPDNYARIAKFIMPKDYVRYKLTGIVAASAADAEKTGFLHTEGQQWDSSLVSSIGYDIVAFPQVVPSNAPSGTVTQTAAAQAGLPAGLPVYGEAGQSVLEYVAMSILRPNVLGIVLGTTGLVGVQTHSIPAVAGGRLEAKPCFGSEAYMLYGTELSCMDSVNWVRDALYGDQPNGDVICERAAAHAPVGSHGVVFLPYLMGERSPQIEPGAKAVFYGLSTRTQGMDLVRSVMEGIVFGLADIYELIRTSNRRVDCQQIVLSGEGSRFAVLRRIVADVFGMPVTVYKGASDGLAYGAALMAAIGEGMFPSMEAAESLHEIEEILEPNLANTEHYRQYMKVYRELCEDLHGTVSGE